MSAGKDERRTGERGGEKARRLDMAELAERVRELRTRFGEFRGRL